MTKKRVLAYIIDFILLIIFSYIISTMLSTKDINMLNIQSVNITDQFILKNIDFETYVNTYSVIQSKIDNKKFYINFIILLYMITYYVVVPYLFRGKTIGKKLLKIKIEKENITIWDYLLRSFIINGTLYLVLLIILNIILPPVSYFITVTFLSIIQIIMVITSYFMVLYKGNGLEDILTSSIVIDEVEK